MLALARIDADLSAAGIDGGPVAWLRDEIVAEVPEVDAEEARRLLVAAMTDAFAETFPGAPLWLADAVLVNSYRVDHCVCSAPALFSPLPSAILIGSFRAIRRACRLRSGLEDLKKVGAADPSQIIIAYNVECVPK